MSDLTLPLSPRDQQHNRSISEIHSMPHAVEQGWEAEKEADDEAIQRLLAGAGQENDDLAGLLDENPDGETGPKAEDAKDWGDISLSDEDEDLPLDSLPPFENGDGEVAQQEGGELDESQWQGEDGDGDADFGDLFGDDGEDAFMMDAPDTEPTTDVLNGLGLPELHASQQPSGTPSEVPAIPKSHLPETPSPTAEDDDPLWLEQRRMFEAHRDRLARGGIDPDAGPAPQSDVDLLETLWPLFDKEEIPQFTKLFMRKRAYYLTKAPPKAPTKVQPTRPNFELNTDQERSYRTSTAAQSRKRTNEEANEFGVLFIQKDDKTDDLSDDNVDLVSLHGEEIIGGVSVQDLRILCEDWDSFSVGSGSNSEHQVAGAMANITDSGYSDSASKRRRTSLDGLFESVIRDEFPSLDDPEALTAKLAKRIPLDMNDSHLLLDVQPPTINKKIPQTSSIGRRKDAAGGVWSVIHKKFNFSNDEEYERLVKENSIRGAVGNIPIEHSGPARRLQYPFYKTNLSLRDMRNFHRPNMTFAPGFRVNFEKKLDHRRAKDMRKLPVAQAFGQSTDMTLADNGSMLLLEYSEEAPLMMSNFGMNSRIINYYRRKDEQDKFRPKQEVGEPRVLMEKDQSPFAKFGFVDPGQTVPTVHNNLYRAPVFRHDPRSTDFLVVRRQTGVHGVNYHLRNLDNLHVVGQQFPFAEVPGTHGRKVTATQKSRMKMIAYRIWHKKNKSKSARQPFVPHSVITEHFPGSDVSQNRSKMREIMSYNKEHATWEPSDVKYLDMEFLRNEIKPEDICLIDSMQVGSRQMQDAGFDMKQIDEDKEIGEDASIDAQLVHWRATKNFLGACGDNAMIALHGEGDPTGRGEGFSFVKISMKGGFQAPGESAHAKITAERKKIATGHKYNVKDQEGAYQNTIRQIWEAQTDSLSATLEPDLDVEMDDNIDARMERNNAIMSRTPRSEAPTPGGYFNRSDFDDGTSHVSGSRLSVGDRIPSNQKVKITRRRRDQYGDWIEETQVIEDPIVAKQYMKRHLARTQLSPDQLLRQDVNVNEDSAAAAALKQELARLNKNMERRKVREAQKAAKLKGAAAGDTTLPGQTVRKCANCGMNGHIKTNKKLCPMLNGTWPDGVPPHIRDARENAAATPGPETPGGHGGSATMGMNPHLATSFNF